MKNKKRSKYDAYSSVKSHQHVSSWVSQVTMDWEIDDMFLNSQDGKLNKKRRSKLGYIQGRKPR